MRRPSLPRHLYPARPRPARLLVTLVAGLLVVGGCVGPGAETAPTPKGSEAASPARPSVYPVIVSSEQAVGPNRFLFSFLDPSTNLPAARPERTVRLAFFDSPDATTPVATADAEFVWAIEGERGLYVSHVTFTRAGNGSPPSRPRHPDRPARRSGSPSTSASGRRPSGSGIGPRRSGPRRPPTSAATYDGSRRTRTRCRPFTRPPSTPSSPPTAPWSSSSRRPPSASVPSAARPWSG
jgi:hypothetical protein